MNAMNAKVRFAQVIALASFFGGTVVVGCGVDTAVVGGECREPYVACEHECVDLANDPAHCGACDVACAVGVACINGTCGGASADSGGDTGSAFDGSGDATVGDGAADATLDGNDDGSRDDGAVSDGSGGDGSDGGANDGAANDGSVGDGSVTDAKPADATTDGPRDAAADALVCTPPLVACGGVCKDLSSDGDNCGVCNRVCASNICIKGVCQGAASGDIVYIGHDYFSTPLKTAQARLLENAVLLAPKTPVRVLMYGRYASVNSLSRIQAILADAQTRTGRTIQVTTTSNDSAVTAVTNATYEVVLVPDQVAAPANTMATLGNAWSAALGAFTHVGGVFVALDGDTGANPQMPQLVTNTKLLTVSAHAPVATGDQLAIIAPTDAIAQGVVTPFAMRNNTSRFATEANGGPVSWVVQHVVTGTPNVVHKIAP